MELASGFSTNSVNPFAFVDNAVANNLNNLGYNTNANLAYVGGQNQAALNNAYGPQGFGGQTDYYSALGAAYGRATGGFGGGGNGIPGAYPAGTVTSAPMPGYQLDPTPDVGAGGGYDPWGGGYAAPTPGSGGYNPFDSSTWSAAPQQPFGGGAGPGSSGRNNLASLLWQGANSGYGAPALTGPSGGSSSYPYQGNPYYLPAPMQGGAAVPGGGGFGSPGFGIGQTNYTGQPGFGLQIGSVGPGSVGQAYGTVPSSNPFTGEPGYGFGGFTSPFSTPSS
jgi:hypothetical protein